MVPPESVAVVTTDEGWEHDKDSTNVTVHADESTAAIPVAPESVAVVTTDAEDRNAMPAMEIEDNGLPLWQHEKHGGRCFMYCCDYRRATLVVAAILVFVNGLMVVASPIVSRIAKDEIGVDDDALLEEWDVGWRTRGIFSGIGFLFAILAAVGALQFNAVFVAANIFWMVTSTIVYSAIFVATVNDINTIDPDVDAGFVPHVIVNTLATITLICPQASFILEVRSGVMSKETYPREEYSCCCTTRFNLPKE